MTSPLSPCPFCGAAGEALREVEIEHLTKVLGEGLS